jgi:hypothetical protein
VEEIKQKNDVLIDVPVTRDEANLLEAHGFKTSSPLPPSQISQDLRKEIIRVITVGDEKKNGAFSIAVATHLERLIRAAKQILMAEKLSTNDVGALLNKNMGGTFGGGGYFPQVMASDDMIEATELGIPFVGSGGKGNENFGVQVIKELVAAAKSIHDSPAKDVEALAVARREGLTDVVASYETKLGINKLPVIGDGTNGVVKP